MGRKSIRTKILAAGVSLLAGLALCRPAAAEQCVNPGDVSCYGTIQGAVDAAAPGELVKIFPGDYAENVTVGTEGVQLAGQGTWPGEVGIGSGTGVALTLNANQVVVSNVRIQCDTDGVVATGSGVQLRNVNIRTCSGAGVQITGDDALVQGGIVRQVGAGGIAVTGNGASVRLATVDHIGAEGISITGDGALVEGNQVLDCGGTGIAVTGGTPQVLGNSVYATTGPGIMVTGGASPRVVSNTVMGTENMAIHVNGDNPVVVKNSSANTETGIEVYCNTCTDGLVKSNRSSGVFDCPGFHIVAWGDGLAVERNVAMSNSQGGFELIAPAGMLVRYNVARSNNAYGFNVNPSSVGMRLIGNVAKRNATNGIQIEAGATGTVLYNNVALGNFGFDLYDEGTGTKLGRGTRKNRFGTRGP